eukprot:1127207-Pleurochrysis_carterae.AAC.1
MESSMSARAATAVRRRLGPESPADLLTLTQKTRQLEADMRMCKLSAQEERRRAEALAQTVRVAPSFSQSDGLHLVA